LLLLFSRNPRIYRALVRVRAKSFDSGRITGSRP
jgi:hypothetical protein